MELRKPLKIFLSYLFCIFLPVMANATTITFTDFSDISNLQLNGNAYQEGNILRLTPDAASQTGSAFYTQTITLNNYFSTHFTFQIHGGGYLASERADGFTFVVQAAPTGTTSLGGGGGSLGYAGIAPSIAVEFDPYLNSSDPSYYHVGIDVDGSIVSKETAQVNYSDLYSYNTYDPAYADTYNRYAWIDYKDGWINVYLSTSDTKPTDPILTYYLGDLSSYFTTSTPSVYAGFTAATGLFHEAHDIISWEFTNEAPTAVPIPGAIYLLGSTLLGLIFMRRQKELDFFK